MEFKNKVALITGASSGIGEEFAKQLHARGAQVILVARRHELLEKLNDTFNHTRPNSSICSTLDLSTPQSLQQLGQYIRSHRVDILVNNAGRGSFGYFEELELASEQEMIALNVTATTALAHAVIPQMKKRREGAIISLSSIAGVQPLPYMATYAATKAFNLVHSLGLRYELAPFGIKVLAVCPGPVATEFGGVARVPGKMTGLPRDTTAQVVSESLAALTRNSAVLYPGVWGKVFGALIRLSPRTFSTWIAAKVLKSTLDTVYTEKQAVEAP